MTNPPHTIILAGGKGTRLLPFTVTFPKPLVPVGDKPILEILLRQLHKSGINQVTLTLGHLSELIRAFINQHLSSALPRMEFNCVVEAEPTGTAGSLRLVEGLTDTFLVMNGDLLTNLDFNDLVAYHKSSGAELTIATHTNRVTIDFGVLEIDDAGRLTNYIEKPQKEYQVSMGVYVYEPSVLELIPPGRYFDFPALVLEMLRLKRNVSIYPFNGVWLDIGRPEDYARAQELYEDRQGDFLR